MILNNNIQYLTQDWYRDRIQVIFKGFSNPANAAISRLISLVTFSMITDAVQPDIDSTVVPCIELQSSIASNGISEDSPLLNLDVNSQCKNIVLVNRLTVQLINYFWLTHLQRDQEINKNMLEIMELSEALAKIRGGNKKTNEEKNKAEKEIKQNSQELAKQLINSVTAFFKHYTKPIAPELITFFNQYEQELTNPYLPEYARYFSLFDATLGLEKAREKEIALIFDGTKKHKTITVYSMISNFDLSIIDPHLDNIKMKLMPAQLKLSSKCTLTFLSLTSIKTEKPTFVRQLFCEGKYAQVFQQCAQSKAKTAEFLSLSFINNKYEEKQFQDEDLKTVQQRLSTIMRGLLIKGEKVHESEMINDTTFAQQFEASLPFPFLFVATGVGIALITLASSAVVLIVNPITGIVLFIGSVAGALIAGGALGVGAHGIATLKTWLEEKCKPCDLSLVIRDRAGAPQLFQRENQEKQRLISTNSSEANTNFGTFSSFTSSTS